jgi:hypothetical protein
LFHQHRKADSKSEAPYLGLRYRVRQLLPGGLQEVDPSKVFHSGDRIILEIESNNQGYIYVVHQGSNSDWSVLFPSNAPAKNGPPNFIRPGQSVFIPTEEGTDIVFDDTPGIERLFVILSKNPETSLERLIRSVRSPAPIQRQGAPIQLASRQVSIPPAEMDRIATALTPRNLVIEKRPSAGDRREEAVYIVNAADTADQQHVVAEIKLIHR